MDENSRWDRTSGSGRQPETLELSRLHRRNRTLVLPVPPVVPVALRPFAPLGALAVVLRARDVAEVLDLMLTGAPATSIGRRSAHRLPPDRGFIDLLAALSRGSLDRDGTVPNGARLRRVAVEYRIGSSSAEARASRGTQFRMDVTVLADQVWCTIWSSQDTVDPRVADWINDGVDLTYRAATISPELPLSALPVVAQREREQIRAWAGSSRAPVAGRSLPELFAAQVKRAPQAIALRCNDTEVTFEDLDARSTAVAVELLARDARPHQIVAICMDRSIDRIVTLLAVTKMGAAYLALEPTDPPARLAQLINEAHPSFVITHERLGDRLPASARCIFVSPQRRCAGTSTLPDIHVDPDDLAYVSFTSGSTGRPKGVCVPHRAVARLTVQPDWISIQRHDVFLQLAPIAFDASTLEVWAPLTNGATLAVHPAGPTRPDAIAATVQRERVTILWLTAGLFHQIVDNHIDALGGLRHLLAGGDVLSATHVRRLQRRYPSLAFTNGYGPTENTTFTTCWNATKSEPSDSVPIGRPINGTRVAILNEHLWPVPVGAVGELYAAGDGLAHGYLNQPDQTASQFTPAPEPGWPGERVYRTGDLARWSPDGLVDFVGRVDTQVKLHGHRVEPGEVEAVLRCQDGVLDTVVICDQGANGDRRLIAYVVPDPGHIDVGRLTAELPAALRTRLPPYLVPSSFVLLPAIPLTDNGKVNRAALPRPLVTGRSLSTPYVPPHTDLEALIAGIWQRALGVEAVGIHDDFFELGGHSLMAADLVREMQRAFGMEFPAQALYLRPTIAELVGLYVGSQPR